MSDSSSAPYRGFQIRYNALAYRCDELEIYGMQSRVEIERAIDERLAIHAVEMSRLEESAPQGESQRQMIGVYVDSDADAARFIETIELLRDGCTITTAKGLTGLVRIPSLDWDSFVPSDEEDEAWRNELSKSPWNKEKKTNAHPHRFEAHPHYHDYCAFAGPREDYCKKASSHRIHDVRRIKK